jgi:hypothetical protein
MSDDEEITLDNDWEPWLRGGDNPCAGAVQISGECGCCGRSHTNDYTPAKARLIAARLVALAEEAEKVEPARLLTQEEADAR